MVQVGIPARSLLCQLLLYCLPSPRARELPLVNYELTTRARVNRDEVVKVAVLEEAFNLLKALEGVYLVAFLYVPEKGLWASRAYNVYVLLSFR